jgi:hypothetical protein
LLANILPSDSFLLVMVLVPLLAVPLGFLAIAGVAVFRRRKGASIGPRLSALLAFAGGASLGTVLPLFRNAADAWPIVGIAGAVAIVLFAARRRVQAGWLLLGAGLPLSVLGAAVLLDAEVSAQMDFGARVWVRAAAVAAIVGIALVLRGTHAPTTDIARRP